MMDFSTALTAMRSGATVTRPTFRGFRGSYALALSENAAEILKVPSSGALSTWQPTQPDILATDWTVV